MGFTRFIARWWGAGVVVALGVVYALDVTGRLRPLWQWLRHVSPEGWSALGTWATAAIALGAAVFALFQVQEARRTREELAQPNVALFLELNRTDFQVLEIVVKNFGQTPAHNITFDFQGKPLKRSPISAKGWMPVSANVLDVYFPTEITYLAPGQEWRTIWDDGDCRRTYIESALKAFPTERYPEGIPENRLLLKRHEIFVGCQDSRERDLPDIKCVIDFEIVDEIRLLRVKNMHDLVHTMSELVDLQKTLVSHLTKDETPKSETSS